MERNAIAFLRRRHHYKFFDGRRSSELKNPHDEFILILYHQAHFIVSVSGIPDGAASCSWMQCSSLLNECIILDLTQLLTELFYLHSNKLLDSQLCIYVVFIYLFV